MCVGDHDGCLTRIFNYKYLSCTVNPATGMERELAIVRAERPKSVLVIGGGPAGMEAARVAVLRGHKVALWEKSDRLGGNLIAAAIPDFKQDLRGYIKYLSTQVGKLDVSIELEKEATPELVQKMAPEVVLVATGATSIVPEIKGVDRDAVVTAIDLLLGKKEVGKTVVVAGGGMIGCELGVYLGQRGKQVTVIEMLGDIATNMGRSGRMQLLEMLDEVNVKVLTNTKLLEIIEEGAIVESNGERRILKANSVVLALGLKPEAALSEELRDRVPELYTVGDCVEPRRLINAIWEAYRTARLI